MHYVYRFSREAERGREAGGEKRGERSGGREKRGENADWAATHT